MTGTTVVQWKSNTAAVIETILAGARDGLDAAADGLLTVSQELVPVLTGTLRDSGATSSGGTATTLLAGVSYDGVEAVVQHEHMEYEHPNGGQAKYLEQPLFAGAGQVAQTIADGITALIGGPR